MPERLQELFLSTTQIASDPTGQNTETVKIVVNGMIDFTPVAGDVKGFADAETGFDYLMATIGIIPIIGDTIAKAAKLHKAGKFDEAQDALVDLQKQMQEQPKLLEFKADTPNATDSIVNTADNNVSSTNPSMSKDGVTTKPFNHYLNNTTNPEVREVFVDQAVNVRTEIPEELANKGNLALADVDIPGLPDKMKAFSRFQKGENGFVPLPQGETILKPLSVNKYGVVDGKESFSRVYDGEFKILETTARALGDNPNATGRIDLFTELKACTSCGGAIQQFRSKYPNIQLNVFTKK